MSTRFLDLSNPVHRNVMIVEASWTLAVVLLCLLRLMDSVLAFHSPMYSGNRIYGDPENVIWTATFGCGILAISFWATGYSLIKRQGRILAFLSLPVLLTISLSAIFLSARIGGIYSHRNVTRITSGFSTTINRISQYQRRHGFLPESQSEAVSQELLVPPEHSLPVFRSFQYIPPNDQSPAWTLRTLCPSGITHCDVLIYQSDQECEYMAEGVEVRRINGWCYYDY